MTSAKIFLGLLFGAYMIIMLITFYKSKRFFTALFLTFLQGICALFAVNLIGKYISVHIPINYLTLSLSSFTGIAGVIMLLLCEIFL